MSKEKPFEVKTARHSIKTKEGSISPEGVELCRQVAEQIFEGFRSSPATIYYLLASSYTAGETGLQRALISVQEIERRIGELIAQKPEANIVMVKGVRTRRQEAEVKKALKGGKKVILGGALPQEALSFSEEPEQMKHYRRLTKLELGAKKEKMSEEDIIAIWCAGLDEMIALKAMLKTRYPGMTDEEFAQHCRPSQFKDLTPEDVAIRQLKLIMDTKSHLQRKFKGQQAEGMHVGHSMTADVLTVAVTSIRGEINLKRWQQYRNSHISLKRGTEEKQHTGLRAELETDEIRMEGNTIVSASFRTGGGGLSLAAPVDANRLIARLQRASNARRSWWKQMESAYRNAVRVP